MSLHQCIIFLNGWIQMCLKLIVLLQIVEGPSGDCKWEVHDPINKTFYKYMQNYNEKWTQDLWDLHLPSFPSAMISSCPLRHMVTPPNSRHNCVTWLEQSIDGSGSRPNYQIGIIKSRSGNEILRYFKVNPLTPKISWVILLTVCHTIHIMLVWRIWNWINQ